MPSLSALLTALPPKARRAIYFILAVAGLAQTSFGDLLPPGGAWARVLTGLASAGLVLATANVDTTQNPEA